MLFCFGFALVTWTLNNESAHCLVISGTLRSSILNTSQMSPLDSDMVIDSMVATGQLKEELRSKVREAMLKKHHHQNERKLSNRIPLVRSFADIGKKHSDPLLLERNGETPLALLFLFHPCLFQFPPAGGRRFL